MKKPSLDLNWLWWGLGSLFIALFIFKLGSWSASESSSDGLGKKVGIVHIKGPIVDSSSIVNELEKFRKRSDISALVVRIDSPGGLVAPTQEIYEKIKRVSKSKPIVSSMGTIAASGGYYLALGSDSLMANAGTIVGSIGVIMSYPIATELLNKVGLKFETIKSGKLKDVGSYSREPTLQDRSYLNEMVNDMYNQFLAAVIEHRPIDMNKIKSLADGRVFTGLKSKELGLIDAIGTFEDAILMAGLMGKIEGKPKVVRLKSKRPKVFNWLSNSFNQVTTSWFEELPAYRWRME